MITRDLEISNKLGLHARAAAKFVALAATFESNIEIENDWRKVNGKSIMGVMMLAAAKGTLICLRVEGSDEQTAMTQLAALVENKFNEEE